MPQKIPVIVIFAPTASGKTALAVNLFGKSSLSVFKGKAEIVSADSMQIYKKLDIGTAKPTEHERAELPHHLIDIRNFDEPYSVSDFVNDADKCFYRFFRNCPNVFRVSHTQAMKALIRSGLVCILNTLDGRLHQS